ncbi:hypothetical protein [Sutcliffiella rhizosphaerae]|uniref:Tetratricopeptide repeat protein n=1 Tax=Sutcliffiella rhizosphaerae TaxID=2880967 RepID=A0ABN8A604_9BACI|nr:hypothetical protein [Sutcliffiella rhizosphaerae]CAG9620474.1 hypothetical protein BACCIP111883_01242 [Sutcliffiella rhizosphaerae]
MTSTILENEQFIFHRTTAINLFNQVWDLMEKTNRNTEEDFQMIHKAHASRFHWGEVGEPVNISRGEWQVSRAYAVLKRPEPSLFHAKRNLEICLTHNIHDFDLAFAYEALARAYSLAGEMEKKETYVTLAKEACDHIEKDTDRNIVLNDLATI